MASIADFGQLIREGLQAVGWSEESGAYAVLVEEDEKTIEADGGAVDAAGDVGRVLRGAVGGV